MDVLVSSGESSSPALDAARAEMTDIATNSQNPRYAGYQRGDRDVQEYLDQVYKKAVPKHAKVEIGNESVSVATDFSEDAHVQAEVETALRAELGDDYDTTMQAMASGAKYLFDGEEGQHALTWLSHRMSGDPKAEALGIKFLADLSKLQQGGRRDEHHT